MSFHAPFVASVALIVVVTSAATAAAQDPLAEGRRHYDAARFDQAVASFDRVAEGDGLSREQAVALLEARALAHHARDDTAGAERDLAALLSLAPEHELTPLAPPALQRAFRRLADDVHERLAVDTTATRIPGGFRVESRVIGDVSGLVRELRVHHRPDGGELGLATGEAVRVPATAGMAYWVEAIGPGGAVIASAGTADSPLRAAPLASEDAAGGPVGDTTDRRDEGGTAWPWILTGAGVLIAAAVVVTILATSGASDTQVGAPMPGMP